MIYDLTQTFTQIAETTGTIQNTSNITTLEMSTSNTPDTGILIYPLEKVSYTNQTIYLRSVDGARARARVIPFEIVAGGGGANTSSDQPDDNNHNIADDAEISDLLDNIFN